MRAYTALAGRIRQTLADLEYVVQRAEILAEKARRTGDDGYWDGVALNLHGFYTGIERVFEDIARHVDETLPTGPEWHRDLLMQMSARLGEARPAVVTEATRRCLDDYRGFRHVVRNLYTFNLRPARLQELCSDLAACFQAAVHDLNAFANFLERLSQAGQDNHPENG